MSEDLESLKLLYSRFYEISVQIGQLIDRKLYNELITFMNKKDHYLHEAGILIEKIRETGEDTDVLVGICQKIHDQELENITNLSSIRDHIKKELNKAAQSTRLLSAYSTAEFQQGNILDYKQ